MKKSFLALSVLISLGLLVSCAVQQSPLSPSTTLIGQSNSTSTQKPIVDESSVPSSAALTNPAVYYFENQVTSARMAMDASTINSSNIQVYYKTSDTEETQVTGLGISYNAALKQVQITPSGGWTDNTRYRVLFTTGIRTAAGAPLDGNGNGIAESGTFDNKNMAISIGAPVEIIYTFIAITAGAALDDDDPVLKYLTSTNLNSVQAGSYIHVTLTVTFSEDVDQSTIFVNTTTLHNNFGIVNNATNAAVSPVSVTMIDNQTIEGVFILAANAQYKLTIMGGTSGVRSAVGSTYNLLRGRLYGGEDTVIEAADKVTRYISTVQAGGGLTNVPPTASASYSSTPRYWTVSFSDTMDQTTLTTANFQLEATYTTPIPDETYNVGIKAIEIVNDTTVRLYVPDSFYPNGDNVSMRVIVNRNVKSTDGIKLDGDGDGIGGGTEDDYRSGTSTVDSQL
ncbi:Ig-like domain-containing protein [bacterium]|nr:Ig-like domain-containing protein [bacterium]